MLKKIIIVLIVLATLAGCNSKTAFNYSQDFAKKESILSPEITNTESKVKAFLALEQYDSIAAAGERMEKMIDVTIKEIKEKAAPDVKEGQNFKEAGIRYFEYMKSVYTLYKDFGNAKTPEDRETELTKLRTVVANKTEESDKIRVAQLKFAEANNFKIEPKK